MMNADTVYKYLGIAVVAAALLHILFKASSLQNELVFGRSSLTGISALSPLAPAPLLEGMTGANDASSTGTDSAYVQAAASIKDKSTKITDQLDIRQNWKAYDDMLVQLDHWVKMATLQAIIQTSPMITNDSFDQKVKLDLIQELNALKDFSNTLNFVSKALDSDPNYKKR